MNIRSAIGGNVATPIKCTQTTYTCSKIWQQLDWASSKMTKFKRGCDQLLPRYLNISRCPRRKNAAWPISNFRWLWETVSCEVYKISTTRVYFSSRLIIPLLCIANEGQDPNEYNTGVHQALCVSIGRLLATKVLNNGASRYAAAFNLPNGQIYGIICPSWPYCLFIAMNKLR